MRCDAGTTPMARLLMVFRLRLLDACVLGITRHRVAFFLRDLVIGFHLVLARGAVRLLRFLGGLRIGDGLVVGSLRLLHAYIPVTALLCLARILGGIVVSVCLLLDRIISITDGRFRRVCGVAEPRREETQRPCTKDLSHSDTSDHVCSLASS